MAVSIDTPIPTPRGWVPAQDITKGDIIFDNRGNQVVVRTTQVSDHSPCFVVTLDDGTIIKGNHQLTLTMQDRVWRDKMSTNKKGTTKCRFIKRQLGDLKIGRAHV